MDVVSGATLIIDDGTGTGTGGGNSQLQGSGNLTKSGLGTFSFDDSTAYAGTITVTAGSIQPASANAFGANTAGTTIQSGAQMNLNGVTMTNTEPLTINGTGLAAAPAGALTNGSATGATWAGALSVASDSDIGGNSGSIIVNGVISGSGVLSKVGTNTVRVIGNSASYAAGMSVLAGTLEIGTSANAAGTGTIQLGDTTGSANARLTGLSSVTHANAITVRSGSSGTKTLAQNAATNTIFSGLITMNDHLTVSNTNTGTITTGTTGNSINLNSNTLTIANTSTGRYFSDGVIFGAGSVEMNSSGTGDWVPRGDHTYSGGTTLTAGLIAVDRNTIGSPGSLTSGPFGTGTFTIAGGQMRSGSGANRTIGNDVTISGDTTFYTTGSEKTLTFTGPVTLSGGNRTLTANVGNTVAGTSTVFSGAIGDGASSFGLTKAGTGNLTLSGENTYDGGTTVNAGTLFLAGSLQTNTPFTISPTVAGGARLSLASGTANPLANVSALMLGSATGPTNLVLELGAASASSDFIHSPNAATTEGVVNIDVGALSGFGSAATYDLITAASGLSDATYALTSAPGGYVYTLSTSDTLVQLGVTAAAAGDIFWRGNTNNSWSALSGVNTNWFTTAAGSTNAQANPGAVNTVNFSAVNASNAIGGVITTTLDNNFTVNDMVFGSDPNGVTSVTVAAGLTPTGVPGILTITPSSSADGLAVGDNAGAVTISAPVILGAAQTWSAAGTGANGSSLTVSGPVTGAGSLNLSGLVTLTAPAGSNTYSGATTVPNGGILVGSVANNLSAASAMNVTGTGILRLNGVNNTVPTLSGTGVVQNNHASTAATLTVGDATDFTFSGTLQNGGVGTLGLTKTGTGKLTLNSTNTHTGMTTVNAGTLILGSATTLTSTNNVTLSATGTLDLNGFDQTVGSFTSAATNSIINSGAGSGTNTLTINTAGPTLAALITDGATAKTALRVNNSNGSTFITANNTLNTFSGGLILAHHPSGTRMFVNAAITGTPWGTSTIFIGETATDRAGIYFATADNNFNRPIVFNTSLGNDRYGIRNDGRIITLSEQITANADAVFSSNSATASNTIITNKVTGAGGLVVDLSQTSTGNTLHTVTLSTAANTNDYTGNTQIGRTNAAPAQNYTATLALGAADQIPNGVGKGNVIINNHTGTRIGFFSLAGFNETINGLSGNGIVDGVSGSPTLTLGDNNATATFSGVIQNGTIASPSGTLNVTKIGSGTQTLSGASSFSGSLNVNGGFIAFPSASASPTPGPLGFSSVVNLNGGGISYTASASNALNRPIAIGAADGTVDVASSTGVLTIATVTSSAGGLIKTGPGTSVIAGSTTLNGGAAGVAVNEGTLKAGFGAAGVATIAVGATGNLDQSNSAIESLTLGNDAGALTLSGGSQLGFELSGATSDSIAVGATGTAVTSGVVTLNFFGTPTAGTYNLLTAPSGLSGATYALGTAPNGFNYTINKTDTLVSVTISAYTPIFWRGGQDLSWNTLGAGSANWTTDGAGATDATSKPGSADTVLFSATGAPTASNLIATTLDAAFTVDSLQFTNTPAGITDVTIAAGSGGSLTLTPLSTSGGIRVLANGGNATISAPLTIGAAQTWDVDPTGSLTISGDTNFASAVNKTNTGALTLTGNNSGSGSLTLSGGTLNLGSSTALGNGILTIGAGTAINTTGGALDLVTNNAQLWNGSFTFVGSNDLNLGTGAVTLGSNLAVTTTASYLVVGGVISDGGNNRGLTKAGNGTLLLDGANSFTGPVAITGGVLRITNSTGLGTAAGGVAQSNNTALEIDGTLGSVIVGAEAFTMDGGGGISNTGAIRNIAGDNTYGGTITLTRQSRINSDLDTLTLSNPIAVNGNAQNLVVGGAGNITISGSIATTTGSVSKSDAGILTLSGNNTYTGNTIINGGTFNLTGSLTGNVGSSALRYGDVAGNTVVNISGNVNNYRSFTGANVATSVAVMNQTAGSVAIVPPNGADEQYLANNGGYGMWNITGGTLNTGRFDGTGATNGNASTAVIYVGGSGALTQNVGDWFLPIRNSGNMSMTIAPGGSFTRSSAVTAQFSITGLSMTSTNNVSYGMLNVAGGTVDTGTKGITFSQGTFASGTFTSTGFVNVAGGTLSLGLNTTTGTSAVGTTRAYFNFVGGTVKATAAMTSVIPASTANYIFASTMFGPVTNDNNANTAFNTQIGTTSNFTGGLTVDTNGFATTFTNPFLAASGFGVTQSNIGDVSLLGGNSGYVGAPMVTFSNPTASGAVPASGYAVIDPVLGKVTGIVITNPGVYAENETPTITLSGGGGSIAPFTTTALATPNTSGGLTKQGLGTLTLSGANTYTGATLISGGALQLNGAAATSPTTNAVTVSTGGTLGFTAGTASTLDLSTKDMTLSGGTLAFDIGDPGVSDTIAVEDFTITANSAFSFASVGAVGGSYTLLTSANPITNSGGFTISGQTIGRVTLTPTINANTITVGSTVNEGKWALTGGGVWSLGDPAMTQDNWIGYKPTVTGDAVLFGDTITAASTVAVDTPHTVAYMRFDNANAYTIGANGSSNLSLNNGASTAVATVTTGTHTIAENVSLLSNLDLLPAASTQLTISGVVSGAKAIEVAGPGTVVLSGVNTYSGTTTVSNGTLTLSGARTATMGVITVGNLPSTAATLNISDGTFTTGQFNVGSGTNAATAGTVNQTGGTLTMSGNQLLLGNNGSGTTVGSNSTGTYNLSGGTLNTIAGGVGVLIGVNTGTTGVFNLSGTGNLNMAATSTMQIARSDNNAATNSTGTFNQTGGTATVGILQMSGIAAGAANNAGGSSTLSLTGGTFTAATFNALSGGNNSSSTITIGGTAQVTLPAFPTNAKGAGATANITFDSTTGFLSPVAASGTYMPAATFTNAYLTANGANFNVPSGRDITVAQVLSDAPTEEGTLTKTGDGTLTLSGANSYTGVTSVNAGTLNLGNIDALGTIDEATTVASGARVTFGTLTTASTVAENFEVSGTGIAANGALNVGGNKTITLSGDISLAASASFSADGGSAFNFTSANGITGSDTDLAFRTDTGVTSSIAGPLDLGTGSLTKTGGAALTLSGNNSYTGGTTITGGILNATTSNNALGTGTVTINGGVRVVVAAGLDIANPIVIGTNTNIVGRGIIEASGTGVATVSGPVTINNNSLAGGHLYAPAGATLHVEGAITSSVTVSQRDGTVMLSGGGTGYSALTTTGTTIVGANNGIATSAQVILGGSANATLDLNGFNQSLVGVARNANTTIIGNSSTTADSVLTTTGTSSYSGTIVDAVGAGTRKVALTVASGSLTLSAANTYTGNTAVNGGTLVVTGSIASTASVGTTGTLAGTGTITGAATVATTGVVSPGNNSVNTLTFGSTLTLDSGSEYAVDITAAATNDRVAVTGALTANGKIKVTLSGYTPVLNDTFDIADAASTTGSPTFDFSAATLSSGLKWDTSTFATNGQIKVVTDYYGIWAAGTFANAFTQTLPGQDQDGDNYVNLMEYAFGTDPTVNSSGQITYAAGVVTGHGQPVLVQDSGNYFAVFGRRTDYVAAGLTYTVEFSPDMSTWAASATTPTTVATDGVIDAVSVPYPTGLIATPSGPKKARFFRVVISSSL